MDLTNDETLKASNRGRPRFTPIAFLFCLFALGAAAASHSGQSTEHWVSTWASAQPLYAEPEPPHGLKSQPKPPSEYPAAFENETVRMIVRVSTGGSRVRIELANRHGAVPVYIAASHIGESGEGASVRTGSDRAVTFGGRSGVMIPPGATVTSDAVELAVRTDEKLAVSLFVSNKTLTETVHEVGLHSTYLLSGNAAASANPAVASVNHSYFWLHAVDTLAADRPNASTVVAFGDSITDGFATTPDKDQAWPTLLHSRLEQAPGEAQIGVVNLGISGNRVLHDGAGANALARFDRDVLALQGVRWVILLEGINDISYSAIPGFPQSQRVSAQDLISGYRMLIAKAHMHGLKVIGGTILPYRGVWTYTDDGEAIRERVNEWVRSSGEFDSIVDFDKATRDPAEPKKLRALFDAGDHVHPNDAGNQAMADAFNLAIFK